MYGLRRYPRVDVTIFCMSRNVVVRLVIPKIFLLLLLQCHIKDQINAKSCRKQHQVIKKYVLVEVFLVVCFLYLVIHEAFLDVCICGINLSACLCEGHCSLSSSGIHYSLYLSDHDRL